MYPMTPFQENVDLNSFCSFEHIQIEFCKIVEKGLV